MEQVDLRLIVEHTDEQDTMDLSEAIRELEDELDMTYSETVEEIGRSVAHLRD